MRGLDPQRPQREQQDDEPLLGAVVEVALEPATGFVGAVTIRVREVRTSSSCRLRSVMSVPQIR